VNTNMFIGLYIACSMVEEIGDLMIIIHPKCFASSNFFLMFKDVLSCS
jgi:hypothetical protein